MRGVVMLLLAVQATVSGFGQTGEPAVERALARAKDLPRLHSLLVSRRGELVLERYFNGARADRPPTSSRSRRASSPRSSASPSTAG